MAVGGDHGKQALAERIDLIAERATAGPCKESVNDDKPGPTLDQVRVGEHAVGATWDVMHAGGVRRCRSARYGRTDSGDDRKEPPPGGGDTWLELEIHVSLTER